jgi:hypothetical protein
MVYAAMHVMNSVRGKLSPGPAAVAMGEKEIEVAHHGDVEARTGRRRRVISWRYPF